MSSPAHPVKPFAPESAPKGASGSLPSLVRADGRPWSALLADDNAINREVGVALLQELGLTVHTAFDGRDAIDKLLVGPYDLVLMDVQMPRLDGLAATRSLRTVPALQAVPVIAMTANASAQSRADCLAAGMNDFVTKPIDILELAATLQRWLPADPTP